MSTSATPSDGDRLLEEMLAKRGYLLSYHRMLAASDAKLLASYDAMYTRLTLDQRVLTPVEREIVWIALIATTRERRATFHFERATQAGMGDEAIADAVALAGACESFDAMQRSQAAFGKWLPDDAAITRYLRMFDAARGGTPAGVAEIAAVVCHAAHRNEEGMRAHLPRVFAAGGTREQLAEGLSYVLLHRGGPTLIDAVNGWDKAAGELGIPGPY